VKLVNNLERLVNSSVTSANSSEMWGYNWVKLVNSLVRSVSDHS
jgi:hypothetical protein